MWFDVIFTFPSCFNSCSLFVSLSLPHVQYCVSPYSFFTNKFAWILSNSCTCLPASFLCHHPEFALLQIHCVPSLCWRYSYYPCVLSSSFIPSVNAVLHSLYLIPPCCPQRALLPLPNLRGLAEAAQPPHPARRGPLLTAAEARPCLWSPVPGCQLCLPPGLRPHR